MLQTKVILIAALAFTATSLLAVDAAHACSCMRPPPPAEALEAAAGVWVGSVQAVEPADAGTLVRISFAVETIYKGSQEPTLTFTTSDSSASCGYGFSEGERYLVYAGEQDGGYHVTLCSRTARLADAADDIAALNAVAPPTAPSAAPPDPATPPEQESPAAPAPAKVDRGARGCGCQSSEPPAFAGALLVIAAFLGLRRRRV